MAKRLMVLAAVWTGVCSVPYVYHFPYHYHARVRGDPWKSLFTMKEKSPLCGGL